MNYPLLKEAIIRGEKFDYLFFWGDTPLPNGGVNKSCLSQWYAKGFYHEGEYFATAEHWMMAAKASLFGDEAIRKKVLSTESPREAKNLGRQVSNFSATSWEAVAFDLVCEGNLRKFSQNEELRRYLLSTGNSVLVEASPFDKIWGIGMDEHNPDAINPFKWAGTNLLGFALMEVRSQLKR